MCQEILNWSLDVVREPEVKTCSLILENRHRYEKGITHVVLLELYLLAL